MRRNIVREIRSTVESSRALAVAGRCVSASNADFAEQRARAGNDFGSLLVSGDEPERAALNDIGAVGGLADGEQHLAGLYIE